MKKTLTVLLLSVVAGLFFSCSNSSDTSTLMTLAVIQQQQVVEAAAVKMLTLSVNDVYQAPDDSYGNNTYHYYYKVTSSTSLDFYEYKNDNTIPESGSPTTISYNQPDSDMRIIQYKDKIYAGTFIAKGINNTSFCTTWTSVGLSDSFQFNTDKTFIYTIFNNPITFTYTISSDNSNLYLINDTDMKVYYDSSSGITIFDDSQELTKVSGLPA